MSTRAKDADALTATLNTVAPSAHAVLAGGGEMGALMRSIDWSATRLGPVEQWTPTLRMMVSFLLANRFPLLLWWGPDYIQLYNDPYRPVLGTKHPASMGQSAGECWSEIWHIIGPLIDSPFRGGPATWMDDIFLEINRHGFVEETHFTIAYSPVPDETAPSGVGGVLATVHEVTEKIVGERRVGMLRDLGGRSLTEARTAEAACVTAARILAEHPQDIPFGLLYLIDADGKRARLAGTAGVEPGQRVCPDIVELDDAAPTGASWPLREAVRADGVQVVEGLASHFERVPAGPWSDPPHTAVVMPIPSNVAHHPAGVLVAGVSARLALDGQYLGFFELLTAQIATAIANTRAYEEEKRRAESLAEVDRAKTTFFSNVSHEFRTPLTLMLGPTADLLANQATSTSDRERLTLIHRNALRLQKLVNSLLDFSRIEVGRVTAVYEPTDLAAYTADLASAFRSATERAGLALVVDAPSLPAAVYVDRGMWEKVVLNLLSNAFKHTFEGAITVRVCDRGEAALVEVSDTGVGIAADELPRVFERFHRVPNARSRTHEGTGIGLALVQELVRWHGGHIEVASREREGTTFAITVPYGAAHLPPDRVAQPGREVASEQESTRIGAVSYVEEALRWLPTPNGPAALAAPDGSAARTEAGSDMPRILLADDNADMRDYLVRLLRPHYQTEVVGDGGAALAAARARRPDVIVADVMMPVLDGFELVCAVKADPRLADVPVILLSARAGEEARVDGLTVGADDYVVKPFATRELLARIGAQVKTTKLLSRLRVQSAEMEAVNYELTQRTGEAEEARSDAERARAEAEAANEAKSRFLTTMSHELRTPLNAIGGYTDLLEAGIRGAVNEEQIEDLRRIRRAGRHLLSLINDVLNYAKIEAARVDIHPEPFGVNAVLIAASTMIEPQARAKHIEFVRLPCDPFALAIGDRDKVLQIALNLLTNAVKFTSPGGRVTISANIAGDPISIAVQDTGRGIPVDQLAAVFEPFVQVGRKLSGPDEGAGLGLSISRGLARALGGDLTVRSTLGEGSTFTLALPRG